MYLHQLVDYLSFLRVLCEAMYHLLSSQDT